MTQSATLTLVDGVRITVPDSLNLITPYVLIEQQDWFEDEIRFLRRLLRPGQKAIDIGANYGVYTLPMAKVVGPTGCVWAFEPATRTATFLAEGIAVNGFAHVVLERSALSRECGTARLALNDNSELNALVRSQAVPNATETVPVVTLDDCLQRYRWTDIDFMKIDAEGEEARILEGGPRFLTELSPLIQYEVKAGAELNLGLAAQFAKHGFDSYRLVPGLDLLVPFTAGSAPDGFLLNLFCCKQERAKRLAANGFLVEASPDALRATGTGAADRGGRGSDKHGWQSTIARMPYAGRLAPLWRMTMAARDQPALAEALACYAISRDSHCPPGARFGALQASFQLLHALCSQDPRGLRLASLARVARDYGARAVAVSALGQLANMISQHGRADPSEPFLAPGERFDVIPPGEAIGNWVLAAALEESERLGSFSSFYTGNAGRPRLEMIHALGFGSPEMERRLRLLRARFG